MKNKCLLISVFVLIGTFCLSAQTLQKKFWVTNGNVFAIASAGNTIYIGGVFTYVGPQTGNFAALDASTGQPDLSMPEVESGSIQTAIADGSGGWYIGGDFKSVGGVARNNIAHIKSDKSVDMSFNPNANNLVTSFALSGGVLYVGGYFTSIGGQVRNRIAALDPTTGNATTWNPNSNNWVHSLAVSGNIVYAGGDFTSIGGQTRNYIAALDVSTGNATQWNPAANSGVMTLAISGNVVYAGGYFNFIGGQRRNFIAAVDASTAMATSWNPDANLYVYSLAVSGNMIYTGGSFTYIGGQERNYIAALDASTANATSWNPNANNEVRSLLVSGNVIYAGGSFTSINGQARNYLAALNASTGNATSWNPNADNGVLSLAVSGNLIYAGGNFKSVGGQRRNHIAALDATTGNLTSWNPDANNSVASLAISNGVVYAGGYFTSINGQVRNYLAALNASTGNATAWNPNANNTVYSLVVSGSVIYAGGDFTTIGGQARNHVAALNISTGNATSWNPNPNNGNVYALAVSGGLVYIGGYFTTMGGQTRNNIAAVDASTGCVTAWAPDANSYVYALAVSGGVVYAGGYFTSIGGQTRNYVAAVDASTGNATSWNAKSDGYVLSLVNSGSVVYAGGMFRSIGGQPRNYLAALDASTGNAAQWNPNANSFVLSLAVSGHTVFMGGDFSMIGLNYRNFFAAVTGLNLQTNTIAASAGEGGTISPNGNIPVNNGANQTFTITPNTGYYIKDVVVDGESKGPVNTYVFTNVNTDHTIYAVFTPMLISISGNVSLNGLGLGTVKLFLWDQNGLPYKTFTEPAVTDADGNYSFKDVPAAAGLQVYLMEPFGYQADKNPQLIILHKTNNSVSNNPSAASAADTYTVNFILKKTLTKNQAMASVYWATLFRYYATGQGMKPYETKEQLQKYIDAVQKHYTPYFKIFQNTLTINDWYKIYYNRTLLFFPGLAKSELASLLLNIVSLKLPQYLVTTMDNRTAGETLTKLSQMYLSANGSPLSYFTIFNYAFMLNTRQKLARNLIPVSNILYKIIDPEDLALTVPENFKLYNNYPNPFNPSTTINFDIVKQSDVTLTIYDIQGRELETIARGTMQPGRYKVEWNAVKYPSGMYFYRITAGTFTEIKKMVLLK